MAAVLDTKTEIELLDSMLAEVAKASNEIKCSKQDIAMVERRLSFAIVLLNEMRWRYNNDSKN